MYLFILRQISSLASKQVPATGLGLFRIAFGLVNLQEIFFLYFFNHLIFDPVPYLDIEFPTIPLFLSLWGIITTFVVVGYRCQFSLLANYLFWLVFINFTPMQRDFDGGFDLFMVSANFFLLFMPADRAFSVDHLRRKLANPFRHYSQYPEATVSVLAYYVPIAIGLGFLYFDSSVHKLFAEHWRNGLGSWLPATQPYYVSALDMSFLLNNENVEKVIGYTILVFQFAFLFGFRNKYLRPLFLVAGVGLHMGIVLTLNIYPFGLAMLAFYPLLVPFSFWRQLARHLTAAVPVLTVFYDQRCPLCCRTVLILNHFDVFKRVDFKNAQECASQYPALAQLSEATLLTDLYALDRQGCVYAGVDTYSQICLAMRWPALLGWLMRLPAMNALAKNRYRVIADNRSRVVCDNACLPADAWQDDTWYQRFFVKAMADKPKTTVRKLSKILVAICVLQLNSTIHYGLIYRLDIDTKQNLFLDTLAKGSNALIAISQTFLGIAPHALYLHDHFQGYDRILAITYLDAQGQEQWLPFVNEQGRLLAPNWGRVHSMWANIAVTPNIDNPRLKKFLMKVTAFWGRQLGLNLNNTVFQVKMKRINAPNYWVYDQLHKNFAAPWITIGSLRWTNVEVSYDLPKDINSL